MSPTIDPVTTAKVTKRRYGVRFAVFIITAALSVAAACAQPPAAQMRPAPVPEIGPGVLAGYLPREVLPDSLALLPAPPAAGSAAFARDEAFSRASLALRGTARWALAAEDADLKFPQAADTFSCALGAPITEQDTPHLYMLIRRSLADAGLSTYRAKDHYSRARPFTVNNEPICTPSEETHLRSDGSYPSGHTAIGWAWALILTELAPDRTDAILARGRTFGQSRVVCNVHWESDVLAGQLMGAATVARLHADPTFLADLDAGKAELAAVRAKGLKPTRDCDAEAAAIALEPLRAP
jgi:acid phosphatase (class A)